VHIIAGCQAFGIGLYARAQGTHFREHTAGGCGRKPRVACEQAQNRVPHQVLGVGAGPGGELRKLRFLLRRKIHIHVFTIRENRRACNAI